MNTEEFSPAKLSISIPKLNTELIHNVTVLPVRPGTLAEAEGRRHRSARELSSSYTATASAIIQTLQEPQSDLQRQGRVFRKDVKRMHLQINA